MKELNLLGLRLLIGTGPTTAEAKAQQAAQAEIDNLETQRSAAVAMYRTYSADLQAARYELAELRESLMLWQRAAIQPELDPLFRALSGVDVDHPLLVALRGVLDTVQLEYERECHDFDRSDRERLHASAACVAIEAVRQLLALSHLEAQRPDRKPQTPPMRRMAVPKRASVEQG